MILLLYVVLLLLTVFLAPLLLGFFVTCWQRRAVLWRHPGMRALVFVLGLGCWGSVGIVAMQNLWHPGKLHAVHGSAPTAMRSDVSDGVGATATTFWRADVGSAVKGTHLRFAIPQGHLLCADTTGRLALGPPGTDCHALTSQGTATWTGTVEIGASATTMPGRAANTLAGTTTLPVGPVSFPGSDAVQFNSVTVK